VGVADASTEAANITAQILDDTGKLITTEAIVLPPLGHVSFDLATQFGVTANQRGTVVFDPPSGGQISVVALSFNPKFAFTSTPVFPR